MGERWVTERKDARTGRPQQQTPIGGLASELDAPAAAETPRTDVGNHVPEEQ